MPPRFAYWTIILEGKPTAFRSQQREELLPTFKQLQTKHPDAVMMWFSRGRLWTSPEEAQSAERRRSSGERRKPDWRPGGEHRDPRARFDIPRDEKRRRFAAKFRRDARDTTSPPSDRQPPPTREQRQFLRPEGKPRQPREGSEWRPSGERPPRDRGRQSRPEWRPQDHRRPPKPQWKPGDRRDEDRDKTSGLRPPPDRDRDRYRGPQRRERKPAEDPNKRSPDKPQAEWRPKNPVWNRSRPGHNPHRTGSRKPGGGGRGGGGQSR